MTTPSTPDRWARDSARAVLGPRATVSLEQGECVVGRREVLRCGTAYTREYGRGPTWEAALAAARDTYAAMLVAPRRTA